MPTISTNDQIKLFYLEENPNGSPSVIFLHGLGATGASWLLQCKYFAEHGYHVIMPDARGFGQSGFSGNSLPITRMAADVAELIRQNQIRKPIIVGISMGGVTALQFALDYPDLASRLVLVNAFAALRPKDISSWVYFTQRMFLVHTIGIPKQAEVVAMRIFPGSDQTWLRNELHSQILQANPRAYRAMMRSLAMFDVRGRLSEIKAPVLVISGERDTTVPIEIQRNLVKGIPDCVHKVIAGGGHAVSVQFPDQFNEIVQKFIENNVDSS